MAQFRKEIICVLFLVSMMVCVYASVTYRVISTGPNGTKAAIDINQRTLFWSLVLRFDNKIKLKVLSGGTVTSSSPEGTVYVIYGSPVESGTTSSLIFESKYDKKSAAKLISATFNGKPVKLN